MKNAHAQPTEVSALDTCQHTLQRSNRQALTDTPPTKPSRTTRKRKPSWKRQQGRIDLEMLCSIVLVAILLVMLVAVPK